MSTRPPRSPQDKKALSYAKDRRNAYGENDKSSRKAIPARKARGHRLVRRKLHQDLAELPLLDDAAADVVESSVSHDVNRVGGWLKVPDQPLGKHVGMRLARRWEAENKAATRKRPRSSGNQPD